MQNGALGRRCCSSLDLTALLLTEGAGRDVADLVTVHTDVRQRVVGQVGQFRNRAAIVDPVGYDAERVHDIFLFRLSSAWRVPRFKLEFLIHLCNKNVQCKKCATAMQICMRRLIFRRR